jgi:hypothetical protein
MFGIFTNRTRVLADGIPDYPTLDENGAIVVSGVVSGGDSLDPDLIGALTETAPASDTASAGLNGRLQRIAQRLTSLITIQEAPRAVVIEDSLGDEVIFGDSGQLPPSTGALATVDSMPVTQAADQLEYEDVAASQTAQVLGAAGALGDYLSHVIIFPETTGAGTVALLDNATSRNIFVTGTLPSLAPITIVFNALSISGAWKITTGANVHVMAFGRFT